MPDYPSDDVEAANLQRVNAAAEQQDTSTRPTIREDLMRASELFADLKDDADMDRAWS